MDLYQSIAKPILFTIHPDIAHETVTTIGSALGKTTLGRSLVNGLYYFEHPLLETKVFGLTFKNPVGIAGGFDKNARLMQILPSVGFGFTEVGSITARPYQGNRRPWNFRLVKDEALIVNYGLKNEGAEVLKKRIASQKRFVPLIVNIAKTNDPAIKGEKSVDDYYASFSKLEPLADIININVSCPNTGDGQMFCENPKLLKMFLERMSQNKVNKPVVLKLKPDLNDPTLDKVLETALKYSFIKGFVVSNLTKNRRLLKNTKPSEISHLQGGLSGKPLKKLSNQMIKKVYQKTGGKYPIIGLGGIFTAEDAYEKICLGASLVELATGLIYGGPATIKRIKQGLVRLLVADGFANISHAVGTKV
ncbi:MAG: dihydroorotate dehydrogenase (quinone) [Candidatus Woykebacteria bacterium RBG_19FT_COMBO_43_10]|uniref:Dihydroorotate dehydrogenase (quinone) n=1 Tax=Candidatus Woykebacteria bacterium RBG_19FT_COMBO_43_10 TaxID=1802598 RepID=A0A1G1WME3_9BACT|nr:MAG: dihydroorotate dehydrogenase (quinone) [Candidatus Woykebacteria bacterium RBG_19FT_COMBO_43_10]